MQLNDSRHKNQPGPFTRFPSPAANFAGNARRLPADPSSQETTEKRNSILISSKLNTPGIIGLLLGIAIIPPAFMENSIEHRTMIFKPDPVHWSAAEFDQAPIRAYRKLETASPLNQILAESTNEEKSTQDKEESLPPYHSIILQAANQNNIDPALIRAVIMAESAYNPKAVSRSGAMGLMQLMPRTARALGVQDTFNPEHNINGGVKYLRQMLDRFNGDIKLALAAYNAGSRYVKKYRGIPPFKETRNYIKKVLTYYEAYRKEVNIDENEMA